MNCPFKTREVPRVLDANPCGETDFDRLTRMMLDEFSDVHKRLDGHEEPFDTFDQRFDHMDEQFAGVHAELQQLRDGLHDLSDGVGNMLGYRKEIDHTAPESPP